MILKTSSLKILLSAIIIGSCYVQTVGQTSLRQVIDLNGTWQIEEGGLTQPPVNYTHTVPVPGLVSLAVPAFEQVGMTSTLRDAFWYSRTFTVVGSIPSKAVLKIGQALYGLTVFINGQVVGDKTSGFAPSYFDVHAMLQTGVNQVCIGVHTFPTNFTSHPIPIGFDYEKILYIPGISDDVQLILAEAPYIMNIQTVPDIPSQSVTVHSWIDGPVGSQLRVIISEAKSGIVIASADCQAVQSDTDVKAIVNIPITNCHLWAPEDPFLYVASVLSAGDSMSTRFGMRSFQLDPTTGRAMLNGKIYFMRGSNITINRFYEDSLCSNLPWNKAWVRLMHGRFKDMHWNSFRYCIGSPPSFWYDIADELGILIENEYPIWNSNSTSADYDTTSLIKDFASWMKGHWNHPSVIIWDACNETNSLEISQVINSVRSLDYSNRPWDDGYFPPARNTDMSEQHPYHFYDPNFRLPQLAYADGSAGWSPGKSPVIVNEYGWLWINRNGTPTTLTKTLYEGLLGKNATPEQLRHECAILTAAETEFWRTKRQVAGVLQFCALDYSRYNGQTSDNWIDVANLIWEPEYYKYVKDAFAPVGLSINYWPTTLYSGATVNIPISIINDMDKLWSGPITLRILKGDTIFLEKVQVCNVEMFGKTDTTYQIKMPDNTGKYVIQAELLGADDSLPVSSYREFEIISPADLGIAYNKPATSSSMYPDLPASQAVDGDWTTRWSSLFSDPQWIEIDLGSVYKIDSVKLYWEAAYGRDYVIQTSINDSSWTTIKEVSNNVDLTNNLTGLIGFGRYIRMYGTARGTIWGYSLWEFLVFGNLLSSGVNELSINSGPFVYPNPFTGQVSIKINLLSAGNTSINIYNISGQIVSNLTYKNEASGENTFNWNGAQDNGNLLKPGIYIYRIAANNKIYYGRLIKVNK